MSLLLADSPEAEGVRSAALADFVDRFSALEWTHGLVVLRHGRIVAECYREHCSPTDRHQLFSLSKSFASSAVGIALGEGLIPSLDAPLVSFFPEYDSPRVSDRMRRVTLRHLLTMSMGRASCGLWGDRYKRLYDAFMAGHGSDMRAVAQRFASGREYFADDRTLVQNLLEEELEFEPGTRFEYNTAATYLAGAVVQKAAGTTLEEYLRDRMFRPLGIADDAAWDRSPDGLDWGGIGLNLTVREIAAAGRLWMAGGVLPDGRRIIPADYMEQATAKQIDNDGPGRAVDWCQGYGFQFWRCQHGAFRADGASGQICVMVPDQDLVVAATAGLVNMQRELDVVWEHLLPALADAPLPPDRAGVARLREAENSKVFDLGPDGVPAEVAGSPEVPLRFRCATNQYGLVAATLRQDAGGVALELVFGDDHADLINAGYTAPRKSLLRRVMQGHAHELVSKAAWPEPNALRIRGVMPCSTWKLDLTVDLAAPALVVNTENWFAHPWLNHGRIDLLPYA